MIETKGLRPRLRFLEFREAGEWTKQKLGTVATLYKGKGISKAEIIANGIQPCIRYGEIYTIYGEIIHEIASSTNVDASELFLSKKNDVIIPSSGETKIDIAKASCVMSDDIALGSDLNVIRSSQNGIFLSYQLNGPLRFSIAKVAQGDTVVHLYPTQIEQLDVLVPSPPEQQKIANCLSSLDALIAAQVDKLDALKTHKKGLIQQLFPRKGETIPPLRFPEFQDAGAWRASTLEDIAEIASGGTPNRSKPEYWNGDIPWVSTSLIDFNRITQVQECITRRGLDNSSAKIFPRETILMAMYGQGKTRGKVAVLGIDAAINQACAAISVNDGISSGFVFQNLAGRYDEIRGLSNQGGQENLSATLIKKIPLSCPQMEEEQQEIADCLSSLDALIAAQVDKLDALKTHKKGLMQQLFPSPDANIG